MHQGFYGFNNVREGNYDYLSSEEAYLGDVGPAPVPGLNAPEERRLESGFMSNGL